MRILTHTRVGDLIEREANFAVAPKTADFVGAHLVAVAGVFIDGTFINICKKKSSAYSADE